MSDNEQKAIASVLAKGCEAYGGESMCELAVMLSMLRAVSTLHQAHHWQTRGTQFYGDHQLFEHLYDKLTKEVDRLAERAVGLGDYPLVNPIVATKQVAEMVSMLSSGEGQSPEQYVVTSLKATAAAIVMIKSVQEALFRKGKLSDGTGNLLQGIADKLEGHVYLLKQRARGK